MICEAIASWQLLNSGYPEGLKRSLWMQPGRASHYDVVISGASFAGLALARALSAAFSGELSIAIVDRGSVGSGEGAATDRRASAVSAGSRRLLDVLGVWPLVAASAQPVTSIELTDSALENAWRPTVLEYDNRVAADEPASHIVENHVLTGALADVAMRSPGIAVLPNDATVSIEIGPASVSISLQSGKVVTGKLLVAADGRASILRELAGIKTVGWAYDQVGIACIVAHERPHGGKAIQHFLPAGPFAILPLVPSQSGSPFLDRSAITWSENAERGREIVALDDAGFLREVERRFGYQLGEIRLIGPRQAWPLSMHLARSYIAPRLALVGDAAHAVHPIAGQGLNLAIRDVAALAEVIADTARLGIDLGSGEALERYQRWRRLDSAVSAATFDGLNRLFSNDWPVLRGLRDAGLGIVDRLPGLKALLVSEAAGLTGDVPRLLRGEPL